MNRRTFLQRTLATVAALPLLRWFRPASIVTGIGRGSIFAGWLDWGISAEDVQKRIDELKDESVLEWSGTIRKARYWDRQLSSEEIALLATEPYEANNDA